MEAVSYLSDYSTLNRGEHKQIKVHNVYSVRLLSYMQMGAKALHVLCLIRLN
jgi:hypothetical protein